jgi:hypothetical protein
MSSNNKSKINNTDKDLKGKGLQVVVPSETGRNHDGEITFNGLTRLNIVDHKIRGKLKLFFAKVSPSNPIYIDLNFY